MVIYGSNKQGCLGQELYTYTNQNNGNVTKEITIPSYDTKNITKSGDLYLYGAVPFRYIFITSCNSTFYLTGLTFSGSEC